jgi:hypothetical protein
VRIPIMISGLVIIAAIATYAVMAMSVFAWGFIVGFGGGVLTMALCAASGERESHAHHCSGQIK